MEPQEQLTKRERKLLRRQERAEGNARSDRSRSIRRWVSGLVIVGMLGGGGVGFASFVRNAAPSGDTFTAAPVHWHAQLVSMSVCGQTKTISNLGTQQHHEGLALLHTHGDDTIHVEGRVIKASDITLGRFFDGIDIDFDTDRFFDKQGSDACSDGNPDALRVKVNGTEISDPRNYSVKDGDKIEIKFE